VFGRESHEEIIYIVIYIYTYIYIYLYIYIYIHICIHQMAGQFSNNLCYYNGFLILFCTSQFDPDGIVSNSLDLGILFGILG
jgi:hypothetical protein